jgi:hypothetical protein
METVLTLVTTEGANNSNHGKDGNHSNEFASCKKCTLATTQASPSSRQRGCYTRPVTVRVQVQNKSLIMSVKRLGAKMN